MCIRLIIVDVPIIDSLLKNYVVFKYHITLIIIAHCYKKICYLKFLEEHREE